MTLDQMKEVMACEVCGKPGGLSLIKCHATLGKKKPLCNEYGKCRISEKSEPQFNYAFSEVDKNIFLKACPGSGKTEVVGLKTAYEIKRWDKEVGGIAVLTFTNNAADVISERVLQFAGIDKITYPHFVGTFDSWLHGYIAHPFAHFVTKYQGANGDCSIRLIDANSNAKFMENKKFKTKPYPRKGPIKANEYYLDREENKYVYCNARQGSLGFADRTELQAAKKKFIEAGFANYQDMENICITILSKKSMMAERLASRFPLIIIDECHDLSWGQLQILKTLKDKGSKLHFVGDLNQAIYEFKKVDPEKIKDFISAEGFEERLLSDNFRSCQRIVDICQKIVNDKIPVKGACEQEITSPCICLVYKDKNDLCKLPAWFCRTIQENKLNINKSVIVTRGWSNVSRMRPSGSNQINKYSKRLAMAIHLWRTGDVQAIKDSISYMGQFFSEKYFDKYLANSRKHYCPECVGSVIRWRLFLMKVLEKCIQNQNVIDFAQTGTEWAKSVRSDIGQIARDCKPFLAEALSEDVVFPDFDGNSFRPSDARMPVEKLFSGQAVTKSDIHIATIHSVKGQTFDSIMLVSAPTRQGSGDNHWEHWLEDPTSEAARLAYVASSRSKHLLVWAVQKGTDGDRKRLTTLGFVPIDLSGTPEGAGD